MHVSFLGIRAVIEIEDGDAAKLMIEDGMVLPPYPTQP